MLFHRRGLLWLELVYMFSGDYPVVLLFLNEILIKIVDEVV